MRFEIMKHAAKEGLCGIGAIKAVRSFEQGD